MARSTFSAGMLASRAFRRSVRSRGFAPGSPPAFAAIVISRESLLKTLPFADVQDRLGPLDLRPLVVACHGGIPGRFSALLGVTFLVGLPARHGRGVLGVGHRGSRPAAGRS